MHFPIGQHHNTSSVIQSNIPQMAMAEEVHVSIPMSFKYHGYFINYKTLYP